MAKSKMQDEVNLTELKGKVEMLSSLSDRYASEKQHLEKEVMELQAKLEASQAKVEQLTSLAADLEKCAVIQSILSPCERVYVCYIEGATHLPPAGLWRGASWRKTWSSQGRGTR